MSARLSLRSHLSPPLHILSVVIWRRDTGVPARDVEKLGGVILEERGSERNETECAWKNSTGVFLDIARDASTMSLGWLRNPC